MTGVTREKMAYVYSFLYINYYSSTKRQCTYMFCIACICMFVIFVQYMLQSIIRIITLMKRLS